MDLVRRVMIKLEAKKFTVFTSSVRPDSAPAVFITDVLAALRSEPEGVEVEREPASAADHCAALARLILADYANSRRVQSYSCACGWEGTTGAALEAHLQAHGVTRVQVRPLNYRPRE